jgi:putative transposase
MRGPDLIATFLLRFQRITRPMLGFKSFDAAQNTLASIELIHMIKKKQLVVEASNKGLTAAEQFYALAA